MPESDTVHIQAALLDDPRFWALPPSLGRALPVLVKLMQQHGQDGILKWTRQEICRAINLGPKRYDALLSFLDRHRWACETEEGWLVLCGPLVPATAQPIPAGQDLQQVVTAAVAAAVPAIIRQYEAERRQGSRKGKGASEADETEMSGTEAQNVPDKQPENAANVPDMEALSRAGAPVDSTSIDSSKSNSSISNDSTRSIDGHTAEPLGPPKMLPADVIQALVDKSPDKSGQGQIKRSRAEALVSTHGEERCLQALLMLASLPIKPDRPGGYLNAVITKPAEHEVPAAIVKEAARLLSPTVRKQAPAAPTAAEDEADKIEVRVWAFQQGMTEEQRLRIDQETVGRMSEPHRSAYRTAIADKVTPPYAARTEFQAVRREVVQEWALRQGSDGPRTSQGGAS